MQTVNALQNLLTNPLQTTLLRLLAVSTLALLGAANAHAQAITVISNSSDARDCYFAAATAATKMASSQNDLATCTRALEHENLTRTDKARTFINRGIVQAALERYQQALADYNASTALVPNIPEAFVSRGNLWYLAEKYERAADEYTKAMQMDFSRMHIALYNRGITYERMGNHDAAIADIKEALKLQPEFKQAKDRLEYLSKPAP